MRANGKGYLVTLRRRENPQYRGLYSWVPFSVEAARDGFQDPYLFGGWTDDAGLIRTHDGAREILHRFAQVENPDSLEIIYVKRWKPGQSTLNLPGRRFLGYDVADDGADFYSIVADNAIGEEPALDRFATLVNENGLFNTANDAVDYLDNYRNKGFLMDPEEPLVVWEVYSVPRQDGKSTRAEDEDSH